MPPTHQVAAAAREGLHHRRRLRRYALRLARNRQRSRTLDREQSPGRAVWVILEKRSETYVRALLIAFAVAAVASSCSVADEARTVATQYPYLCSGALRDARLADLADGVVAQCEGITVTQKDLDAQIGKLTGSTREQARRYPVYTLEQYFAKQLTLVEAKDWAKKNGHAESSDDQLAQSYLAAQVPKFEVSDKEAEDFYKEHASMFGGGSTYEQVKDTVVYFVRDQKTSEAQDQFTGSAGRRHQIIVSASWVRSEHARWAQNPVEQARLSGKPTYVNFGVIGCCDKMNPVTQALRLGYGDTLNVVFVHTGQEEILSDLYGVSTIPVQLLFDKDGKLLLRHQGNISKEQVLAKFAESGINLSKGNANE